MRQLEELSSGLGPASALEGGLDAALRRLAADASVPTQADGLVGRLPQLVEATAFFVCSEGLANIAKHARASRAAIRAHERAGRLIVEVLDDGVGGVDPLTWLGPGWAPSTGGVDRRPADDRGCAGRRHAPPRQAAHRPLSRPRPATRSCRSNGLMAKDIVKCVSGSPPPASTSRKVTSSSHGSNRQRRVNELMLSLSVSLSPKKLGSQGLPSSPVHTPSRRVNSGWQGHGSRSAIGTSWLSQNAFISSFEIRAR